MPLMPRRRHFSDCRHCAGDDIDAGAYAIITPRHVISPAAMTLLMVSLLPIAAADAAIIFHAISDCR
jgi:hypothetical protein